MQWNSGLGHSQAETGTYSLQYNFLTYFGILNAFKFAWLEAHTYKDRCAEMFCEWWFNELDEVTVWGLFCQNQTQSAVSTLPLDFTISSAIHRTEILNLKNKTLHLVKFQDEPGKQ